VVVVLTNLIAEDLDLAGGPVQQSVGARAEVVRVDLQVQRQTLHALLGGEVGAQGVDADVHLETGRDGGGKREFSDRVLAFIVRPRRFIARGFFLRTVSSSP